MFEDILFQKHISILQLSKRSGIGYNYVYKIVNNQTDFNRCGLETVKKLGDVLQMDLNSIYEYKCSYFARKIYYQDQTDWDIANYGELNAELNKLFQIGIEYHFARDYLSRDIASCKQADFEIRCIKYSALSERTKCIMTAILNQQRILERFTSVYNNLTPLTEQKPLAEKLYLSEEPYDLFPAYSEMNIAY